MNNVLKLVMGVIVVYTMALVSSVSAKQLIHENQEATLQELSQVRLVVNIGLSLEGPIKQGLWKDTEQQLQEIPIRVLPEDSEGPNELPALIVDVAVLKTTRRTFFFLATARLYQQVLLARDAKISSPGITWRYWLIGEGDIDNIRERVKMVVSRFISDFRNVNQSK